MKQYKLLMLILSLVILSAVIYYADPVVMIEVLSRSNPVPIVFGFLFAFTTMFLGVWKWKILLNKVSYKELVPIQIFGFALSNFTPGKAAEPAKAVILKMRKGVPISLSLTSIIWERITDVIALLLFSLVAIGRLSISQNFFVAGVISVSVFIVIIAVSITVLYNKGFGKWLFRIVKKFPILKRLPDNFMDVFYTVQIKKRNIIKSQIIALVTWGMIGFVLYFVLIALGVEVSPFLLAGVTSLSIMIGIASSLPGGVGTTEVVMILLLGVLGVETTIATTATIIFRLITIWMVNLSGGVCFVYLSRKFEIRNVLK